MASLAELLINNTSDILDSGPNNMNYFAIPNVIRSYKSKLSGWYAIMSQLAGHRRNIFNHEWHLNISNTRCNMS